MNLASELESDEVFDLRKASLQICCYGTARWRVFGRNNVMISKEIDGLGHRQARFALKNSPLRAFDQYKRTGII